MTNPDYNELVRKEYPTIYNRFLSKDSYLSPSSVYHVLEQNNFDIKNATSELKKTELNARRKGKYKEQTRRSTRSTPVNQDEEMEQGTVDRTKIVLQDQSNQVGSDRDVVMDTNEEKQRPKRGKRNSTAASPSTAAKKLKAEAQYFESPPDTVVESENLEVMGEQTEEESADDHTLPMRTLDNFVLYDVNDGQRLRTLDDIGRHNMDIRAFGDVAAIYEEADDEEIDDEDDDGEPLGSSPVTTPVHLTCIFFWQVYMNADGCGEIWLQTQYGWYKLLCPAPEYASYYDPIFTRVSIANIAETVLHANKKATYSGFIKKLRESDGSSSSSNERRYYIPLTEEGVHQHLRFIVEELTIWADENDEPAIHFSPLMKKLVELQKQRQKSKRKRAVSDELAEDTDNRRTVRNINLSVLQNPNPTCVTTHIATIAKDMFARRLVSISEAATEAVTEAVTSSSRDIDEHEQEKLFYKSYTSEVKWSGKIVVKEDDRAYYEEAVIDGEKIKVGDHVYMRNDSDEPWFAQIMYMYEDKKTRELMFHARYFSHGKETVLQEFAGKKELFLLDDCSNNNLNCIMGKCNLVHLNTDEKEPMDVAKKNWWFYRYWYDTNRAVFEDARRHEETQNANHHRIPCLSCERRCRKSESETVQLIDEKNIDRGFAYMKQEYHLHDFVYMTTGKPNEPYQIGQIVGLQKQSAKQSPASSPVPRNRRGRKNNNVVKESISPIQAKVRLFQRQALISTLNHYDVSSNPDVPTKDAHELLATNELQTVDVLCFEGTCWVQHIDRIDDLQAYKDGADSFYIRSKMTDDGVTTLDANSVTCCEVCKAGRKARLEKEASFDNTKRRLISLDIFSGCGGLTCGMDMTGVVETKYAIEFSPSASLSFEKNFPGAVAYNQCANILLQRAIALHAQNETLEPMLDHLGRPLKDMPAPGEIDFIYCGPPCQGFSGINRFKKADDIKNTLVCTALSYVDFYKPTYFLLENVRGLINFKLGGEQIGENKIQGGIQMGVVKYILRTLTSMGYQTRFSIQQAGHYGVAQSRRRLFIWGAKIGHTLPDFPKPITCFPKNSTLAVSLPDGTSFNYIRRTNGQAPLPTVTVGDCISELPAFEYENTNSVYPKDDSEPPSTVKQLKACNQGIVGPIVQMYNRPPLTDFQNWVRKNSDQLHNHFTRAFNAINVERIYNIRMEAGADHSSLPEKLKPWCLSHNDSAAARHNGWKGLYGRLDFNGQFQTTLTEMSPMGKQGTVIHPNQRRVLTVRECARAQGFPDVFIFCSTSADGTNGAVRDMYRQVGNAVPVLLALALGKKLKEAMIQDWCESGNGQQQIE